MSIVMASALVFGLIAAAVAALYMALWGGDRALRERYTASMIDFQLQHGGVPQPAKDEGAGRMLMRWAVTRLPEQKDPQAARKLATTLTQAGFRRASAAALYRIIRIGAAMVGAVALLGLAYIRGKHGVTLLSAALAGGVVGAYAPAYYVAKLARRRQGKIARQLSDVLDLLVVCVEAGLGLFESIKVVGDETANQGQEVGEELSLVSGEVGAGTTLGHALRNFAARTAVEDVKPLAATLIQSEQLGAQISPALRSSSDMMRTKRRLRAEEAAQRSTIKILFPLVLFILPAMLIVILAPAMIEALRTLHM